MRTLLLAIAFVISVNIAVFANTGESGSANNKDSLLTGLVLNNLPTIIMGIVFLMRLESKIALNSAAQSMEIQAIQTEIERIVGSSKEDIAEVKKHVYGQERTLLKLIEYINNDQAKDGKNLFVISKYDQD